LSYKARLILAGAGIALILAACSGGATPVTPSATLPGAANAARHGWISPAAKGKKVLYVTDYTGSAVLIYNQNDTGEGPIGEITSGIDGPQGDAVDAHGKLYVANQAGNTVTEYPRGATKPSVTLSTDIASPLDVSVDSHGIVYVMDNSSSEILEFKPGSTSPDATVSLTKPSDAVNAKDDDLYVSYNTSSYGRVARCKPLATSCTDLGITVGLAQGIALDRKGNLVLGDYFGEAIKIYHPNQTSPFRSISVYNEEPGNLAFTKNDATFYMADPQNSAVEVYDYASGTRTGKFRFGTGDELDGVALSPGQKPGK
jgi:sugar lactone lactonase YvrE